MDREQKALVLGEVKEAFENVASVIIADYRGITVPVVTAMRDDFRKNGCHYRVIKNSLVKIAVKGSKMEPLSQLMVGTTAVIWSNEIPQTPAKLALQWAKDRAEVQDHGRLLRGPGPRCRRRRLAVEDAGQGRDPRLAC
jgi:large subunit ribosomal protein L10